MTNGIISKDMGIYSAAQFLESISEPSSNTLFLTIGRTEAFSNEASPDTPMTDQYSIRHAWDSILEGVKIRGTSIRHVIPRNDWTANTIYTEWNPNSENNRGESNANFYVVNSQWNVFKCISNNGGANSIIEPTSTSVVLTETEDGYIWKFLYSISDSEQLKFTTADYIPVKTIADDDNSLQWDVQSQTIAGSILSLNLIDGGENYSNANTVTLVISGDGSGATANAVVNTTSNSIESVYMTSYGAGYSNATVSVVDSAGLGSNANVQALISPYGGHGYDPLFELGGSRLMINARLDPIGNPLLSTNTTFRQVMLIKDPLEYGSTNVASNTYISQIREVSITGSSGDYQEGEYVYQGANTAAATFIGLVAQWDSGNSKIKITNVSGQIQADTIYGANTGTLSYVTSISNPSLIDYSGKVLYINNIVPLERDEDQAEDFKIVLEF